MEAGEGAESLLEWVSLSSNTQALTAVLKIKLIPNLCTLTRLEVLTTYHDHATAGLTSAMELFFQN